MHMIVYGMFLAIIKVCCACNKVLQVKERSSCQTMCKRQVSCSEFQGV